MASMPPQAQPISADGAKVLRRTALMRRLFSTMVITQRDALATARLVELVSYVHQRNVAAFGHLRAEGVRATAYADALKDPLPVADTCPATLADFEDSVRGGL